jgi:hypothetical protein
MNKSASRWFHYTDIRTMMHGQQNIKYHSFLLYICNFRLTQHTLNILFYTQATCFDLQEVIIRPFKNTKSKITVLACTWDPRVLHVLREHF